MTTVAQKLDRTRFVPFIVAGPGPLEAEARASAETIVIPGLGRSVRGIRDVRVMLELTHLFRKLGADIVHTNNTKDGVLCRLAARFAGVPVNVRTFHGNFAQNAFSELHNALATTIEHVLAPLTDHFTVVDDLNYDRILEMRITHRDRLALVYNGFDASRYRAKPGDRERFRSKLGLSGGDLAIVHAGYFRPVKAHADIITAWKILDRPGPAPQLHFFGDGPLQSDIKQQVKSAGLEHCVTFHGFVTEYEKYLCAFDVFILPSLFEGFSRALVEAGLSGLVLVASDVGGHPAIFTHDTDILFVRPGAPTALAATIKSLSEDPRRRKRLSRAAQENLARRFDLDRTTKELQSIYVSALKRKKIEKGEH